MRVTASSLRVRSGPGTDFRQTGSLKQDQTVTVHESRGEWVWVNPGNGWVSRAYLVTDGLISPVGEQGIRRVFGAPGTPAASAGWAQLPEPLKLGWSEARITRFACHVLLAETFTRVFHRLWIAGLWDELKTFDGCYNDRLKTGSSVQKSTHAWGIAVDLNAATNRLRTMGDMPTTVIEVFEDEGFSWGGLFSRKDPMHFQFARGY